jgi:hypothetical protein
MSTTLPRSNRAAASSCSAPRRRSRPAPVRSIQFGRSALPVCVAEWEVNCLDTCRTVGLCVNWPKLVDAFRAPALRYVVSNTSAAGLAYVPEPVAHGICPRTLAAKVAALLYQRFVAVHADPEQGLVFLPCEPVAGNGEALRRAVLEHAQNWALPGTFAGWVQAANTFASTRIEPREGAAPLWVIDAERPLLQDLPLAGVELVCRGAAA